MKKIYTIFVCICLLACFVACEKDKEFALTTLSINNEVITPAYNSADVRCSFKTDATISDAYVQYSLSSSFAKYDVAKMTEEKGIYAAQLVGLADNTTYYIRYEVSNKYSSVVTEEVKEFQTLQCTVPTIVLDTITDVTDSHAKVQIHLTFDGGASVTDMGVCWSTQANPTTKDIHVSTEDTLAVLDITSLQPNTKYYIRAYAMNKVGVAYSEEKVFTTLALPEVRTEDVSDIQVNSALLSATLVFDGNDTATIKGFCWSEKSEPTIEGDHIAIDTASAGYTYLLTALLPETQYFVRAYAQNKIGIVYGEEVSFTTKEQSSTEPVVTETITVNGVSFKMVAVGGGTFTMGATSEQGSDATSNESPTHSVTLSDFAIGETEVTQELWQAVMGSNPSYFSGTNLPVEDVSWNDCQTFISKLNNLTGKNFRLPTEAEWEYAARGGNKSKGYKYAGSNTLGDVAWYDANSSSMTHPVKQKQANELGLYDMSGNVWEWCQDWYGSYSSSAQTNPTGPTSGSDRVDRGGCWDYNSRFCRVSHRDCYAPEDDNYNLGLRLALGAAVELEVALPTLTTNAVTQITETTAVAGGNVTADGNASVTERGIVYGKSPNPTISNLSNTIRPCGSGMGEFTYNMTDLQPGTTYYVRAYAINEKGTAYGEEVTFTTNKQIVLPSVTTAAITQITETSAVAGGNVTSDGGASVTERGVVYATTQNPTTADNKVAGSSGVGTFTCNLTDLQPNTTYYVRAYAINNKGTAYGEEVTFTTKVNVNISDPTGTENGYGYVDLGLSVKWATMNVGATKLEDYGDHFAWGETEPKEYYEWSTYKWCDGTYNSLTKYNVYSSYGIVDDKTQLELLDDAANVNWGANWRLPTDEEWTELREQCVWKWRTWNGKKGYIVTGNNNKSIFLPAAGYKDGYDYWDQSYYWSSSLDNLNVYNALSVHISADYVQRITENRNYGFTVRPVLGETVVKITIPTIATSVVTQITEMSAVAGGNVTSDGGVSVTERGVVYSINQNPTTADNKILNGSGMGSFTCNLTSLQPNTTYYVRAYAVNSKGTAYGEEVSFTTKEQSSIPSNGTENGHEYVDLGLSVKWATCNVGASYPEDYGDYFAWGETTTKSTYNWSTYKHCNNSKYVLKKYNTFGDYGVVDNKTILELSDDAAHVNMGGEWRMPTETEWAELREQCTWTWSTQDGINGYKVISNINGNSIFFPTAGCSNNIDVGIAGYYWSIELYTTYYQTYNAYYYHLSSSQNVGVNHDERYKGMSIRAVCP